LLQFLDFGRLRVVLKNLFVAVTGALLLGWSAVSIADEYRPDQFLGLDLSRAVLSPNKLGPTAEFEPLPVEASGDRDSEGPQVGAEPTAEPRLHMQSPRIADLPVEEPRVRVEKPRLQAGKPRDAARTKLARHGNLLDAQAFDARVQVWPCRSGGICNWKR
jgi:hypothetical protein